MKAKNPTLQWIKSISKPIIPGIIAISILGALDSVCSVILALLSKNVIDFAVAGNYVQLKYWTIILVLVISLQFLLSFLYMRVSANVVAKHSLGLQKNIFAQIMDMRYEKATAFHTGELLNRITSDSDTVICAVIGIIPAIVSFATGIIAAFGALLVIQPMFAITCLVAGVIVGIGAMLWGRRLKRITLECRRWIDKSNSFMMECIQNILVIKSFCNEKNIVGHAEGIQSGTYKALKKRNTNNIFASLASEFVFTFGYFLALGWGAFGIAYGRLSYGNLMAMVQLVGKIQSPFKGVASVIPRYFQMLASAERIMDVVNSAEEKTENQHNSDFESICFNNVSFGYDKESVLKNVNIQIAKGDFVLISGISGIGKSTLLKLLLAMYSPSEGSISIRYKNCDEKLLNSDFRKLCSYVPQGNMVISGTIEENVVFFSGDTDEKKVEECLKLAELWDDVSDMPNGCATIIGENGAGLSEGQVQRLAVARALYRSTPVILLDECTSALDSATELKMLENIRKIKGKTCVLISHKNAAENFVNKRFLIDDGKVVSG